MADNRAQIIISARDETKAAFDKVKGGISSLNAAISNIGLSASVAGAVASIAAIGKASISAAMEAEQASARISATLKATGYSAGLTKSEIDNLADSLAKSTQFDDESLRNAAAAFLKFGNIQDGVFQRGIQLSADLAAFLGTDVADAANTVGKALSSPTEGLGALERQIGKLTEAQKNAIKAAVDSGNATGAQAQVLDVLQGKIGGTADTMNTGLTKATNDAKKAWDEFLEAIGKTDAVQKPAIASLEILSATLNGFDIDKWIAIGQQISKPKVKTGYTTDEFGSTKFVAGNLGTIDPEKAMAAKSAVAAERQRKADAAAAKAADEKAKADEAARKAAEAHYKAAAQFVSGLQKQAETLGLTKDQLLQYEAAHAGLNSKQLAAANAAIARIGQYEKEKKAAEDLKDVIKALADEEDRMSKWSLDDQAVLVDQTIEKLQKAKGVALDMAESIVTPAEKYNQTMDQINAAWQNDLIDDATWQKAAEGARRAQDELDSVNDKLKDGNGLANDLGLTFSSAFEDAVISGKKFSDVLKSLAQDVERVLLRKTVTEPLTAAVSGWFDSLDFGSWFKNADGGVYASAGLSAYSGQIVNRPTLFPFANGIGLMGEAGPEAIMPLTRGHDGRLGVAGGGANLTVNIIGGPSTPQVNRTADQNGNVTVDVIFERVENFIGKRIAKGEGAVSGALQSFGLNRGYGAQG